MTPRESPDRQDYGMLSDLSSQEMMWGKSSAEGMEQPQLPLSNRELRRFLFNSTQPDIAAFLAAVKEPSMEQGHASRQMMQAWPGAQMVVPPGEADMDQRAMRRTPPAHLHSGTSEAFACTPPSGMMMGDYQRGREPLSREMTRGSEFSTPSPSGNDEDEDEGTRSIREAERRAKRRKSNRDSARNTRMRKSKELQQLRLQYNEVAQKNARLQQQVQDLNQTNEVLATSLPSMGNRYREVTNENSKLRNMVERLRFHLVNQLAVTGHSLPGGLTDEELEATMQAGLGNPFDPGMHGGMHPDLGNL